MKLARKIGSVVGLMGTLAVLGTVQVSACGIGGCAPAPRPATGHNGLPTILAIDGAGVIVFGVLLMLAVLYIRKRRRWEKQ